MPLNIDTDKERTVDAKDFFEELIISDNGEFRSVSVRVPGNSMSPFLINGEDSVILEDAHNKKLKRGDIVVFRLNNSFVLHRIHSIKHGGYLIIGDNSLVFDGTFEAQRIVAVVTGIYRCGKKASLKGARSLFFKYIYSVLPVRRFLMKVTGFFRNDF